MGLDMYLYAKVSTSQFGEKGAPKGTNAKITKLAKDLGMSDNAGDGNYGHAAIEMQIGYWRKANHIHRWFVEHCQNGVDECQWTPVPIEKLTELHTICNDVLKASKLVDSGQTQEVYQPVAGQMVAVKEPIKVIAEPNIAMAKLPTTSGFFFGGTDYDSWYLEDVKHTIKVLDQAAMLHAKYHYNVEFAYQSSW